MSLLAWRLINRSLSTNLCVHFSVESPYADMQISIISLSLCVAFGFAAVNNIRSFSAEIIQIRRYAVYVGYV